MKQDNQLYFGYYAVCLIDILGQQEKLNELARFPTDKPTPELISALKKTAGTVLVFRDQFIKFFDMLGDCTMPEKLMTLDSDRLNKYHRFKDCKVNVQRFSDTFVFYSSLGNARGELSVTPLYRIFAACCMTMLWSLAAKVPVRGAISIGKGMELEDDNFYGPVLAEVHNIESKKALYPRIVVSQSVRNFLDIKEGFSPDHEADKWMKNLNAVCETLIAIDSDGEQIVDYLGKGLREIAQPVSNLAIQSALMLAYKFICSEITRFEADNNSKLLLRYRELQRYFETRLPEWQ